MNALRQERTEDTLCPGYIEGVNSFDARVLCGNWAEERCDKAYKPSEHKRAGGGKSWSYRTTYQDLNEWADHKVSRPHTTWV